MAFTPKGTQKITSSEFIPIRKITITNFKRFKTFEMEFNQGMNILVGDNESGKSTILEAVQLVLTGLFRGKYVRNNLSQYMFNSEVVSKYLEHINNGENVPLPFILIELYFDVDAIPAFDGDLNSKRLPSCGLSLKIHFDETYQNEYDTLVNQTRQSAEQEDNDANTKITSLPMEYFCVEWRSFARDNSLTSRSIPVKTAMIDSSNYTYFNGSDIYISRIIRDLLSVNEIVQVAQAHRQMRDSFDADDSVKQINTRIAEAGGINVSDKKLTVSVDLSSKNAWETSLITYLDNIPFEYIGQGEQCIIKTKLALSQKKSQQANILLVEEPENHLSYSRLNNLIESIKAHNQQQTLVTTHSSFVANKLGINDIKLIGSQRASSIMSPEFSGHAIQFFQHLAGYDTLRLVLCKKAILVEGDSDELIVQRAYMDQHKGRLPIQDGIDVISVGTAFLNFLEISEKIQKPTIVVTDNDGDISALQKKYKKYEGPEYPYIKICYSQDTDSGTLTIGTTNRKPFNYNTLEPYLLKANNLELFNTIFNKTYESENKMHKYMHAHKTECALAIFNSPTNIEYPQYIQDAIADEQ